MADNPLGKSTEYPDHYRPDLLSTIPRNDNRHLLGLDDNELPFKGTDIWNAYEISCLDSHGKPMVFIGRFIFPADSRNLVESKSLKMYLNSLNQEKVVSPSQLAETIARDLSRAAVSQVEVTLSSPDAMIMPDLPAGKCLDALDVGMDTYEVSRSLLEEEVDPLFEEITEEVLYTNLFRSNCPITNQPDWATVTICYRGRKIPDTALLKYLVSYRRHNDYHENCVERIFCDLMAVFELRALTVEANFLRRGGLDINPVRTTEKDLNYEGFPRFIRQ